MASKKKSAPVVETPAGAPAAAPAPVASAPAAPAAAAPAEPKPERVKLPEQNGVTRPAPDTKTGRVWALADEISAATSAPARRKAVIEAGQKEGLNVSTLATQYGRWRKFNGLKGSDEGAAETEAAPAAAAAAQ